MDNEHLILSRSIRIFFVFQSLYFYIVPIIDTTSAAIDSIEQAAQIERHSCDECAPFIL